MTMIQLQPKSPRKVAQIGVRIDDSLKSRFERVCERYGLTVSTAICQLIEQYVAEEETKNNKKGTRK